VVEDHPDGSLTLLGWVTLGHDLHPSHKRKRHQTRHGSMPEIIRLFTVLSAEALDESHPAHGYFRDRIVRGRMEILASSMFGPEATEEDAIDFMAYMDGLQLMWLRDPSIDFVEHAMRFVTRLAL
jgi:hypothetical protein